MSARRVDDNQTDIVGQLRARGISVQILSWVGKGVPDIMCGYAGRNFLFEIKDGAKSPSRQKLTADEAQWHNSWRGQVMTITSAEDAIIIITRAVRAI